MKFQTAIELVYLLYVSFITDMVFKQQIICGIIWEPGRPSQKSPLNESRNISDKILKPPSPFIEYVVYTKFGVYAANGFGDTLKKTKLMDCTKRHTGGRQANFSFFEFLKPESTKTQFRFFAR